MHHYIRPPFFLAALLSLAGCTSLANVRDSDRTVDRSIASAEASSQAMRDTAAPTESPVTVLANQQYVNTKPIKLKRSLATPCNITFRPFDQVTLFDATKAISRDCHLSVRVGADAAAMVNGGASPGQGSGNGAVGPQGIPLPPGVTMPPPVFGASAAVAGPQTIAVNYVGPLDGLLDILASRFGISWRTEDGAPVFFVRETRFFHIYDLPQTLDSKSTITSGNTTTSGVQSGGGGVGTTGSSGGGVSGSNGTVQTTTLGTVTDPVKDVTDTIQSMAGAGGTSHYSASNSTLVVTDTPENLDKIEAYVNDLNAGYSKQVLINVRILSVTVNDNDSYGLNWTAVYTNLANNYNIKLSNTYTAATGAVTGAVNILSGNSKWNGSQALVNALATQGRVRVLTEPSVLARNNKPTPVQVARQTGYLAQSQSTLTSGGTSSGFAQTSLQPGTVTTGFNMNIKPLVYPDNKTVELQLSINLSELVEIVRRESGDSAIETPTIDNKMFSPDVTLQSGDTAVIATFKQESADNERSGVGSARNWLFGGGITGKRQTTYVVITLSPTVRTDKIPSSSVAGVE